MDNKYQTPFINQETYNESFYDDLKMNTDYCISNVKKGTVLYKNDVSDKLIFVAKGRLKLTMSNALGAEKMIYFFYEKTFCTPFLAGIRDVLNFKLIADTDCTLTYFSRDGFADFIISDRDRFNKFIFGIEKRFAILYSNMLDIQTETSKNRIYNLIYQTAINNGAKSEQGYMISSFPSVKDISLITGVHTRNIYKYLQELEDMGVIYKEKRVLLIKNMPKLRDLIEEGCKI